MKTSKFFLSTLIAAAAMTATVYAEIDSALGTLEWTTVPSTGGNFWGGNYELTFNFTEEVIKTLDADKSYVLAAYWGSNHNNPDSNALLLNYSESEDKWTLQLGRGELTNGGYGSAITSDTTYAFSNSVTFKEAIVAGMTYTLSVTGGDQAMTPTLSWDGFSETLSSYAGNMNGGNGSTTMNYGLLNLYYTPDSDYVWGGGESGNWSDDLWSTGGEATSSLPYEDSHPKVTFASSVVMTATEAVSLSKLTVNEGVTLTLEGGLEKISSWESSGTGTIKGAFSDAWGNKFDIGAGFAGTLNVTGGKFTITSSNIGNGSYVLEDGVCFQTDKNATISNNITFNGSHEFHTNNGHTLTLSGKVVAEGSLTKKGAGTVKFSGDTTIKTLNISDGTTEFDTNTSLNSFSSAVTLTGGKLVLGKAELTISDSFGAGSSITASNSTIELAIAKSAGRTYAGDIELGNNVTLSRFDGGVMLSGDVVFGTSSGDTMTLTSTWGGKGVGVVALGVLSGSGTVNLNDADGFHVNNTSGKENTFSGTFVVGASANGNDGDGVVELSAVNDNSLKNATINLAGGSKAKFVLAGESITVAGLSGTSGSAIVLGSDVSASTLTINGGGEFAGALNAGVTLKKSEAGMIILTGGSKNGNFVADGGTIRFGSNNASNEEFDYIGAATSMTAENGGIIDLGVTRQTLGTGNTVSLKNGGKIIANEETNSSGNNGSKWGNLDFSGANTILAEGTGNQIDAFIRLRSGSLTLNVAENSDLEILRKFNPNEATEKANGIIKTGAGTLTLSGDNSGVNYGTTTISQGTLVAADANALGTGALKLNGGTFGTSLDTFSVVGAVELGEGTTSTINLGKYTNGAFDTSKVARITIDNEISGAGSLAVVGNIDADDTDKLDDRRQRLTLSGNNSYTGGTTLSGARVEAASEKAFGEGNLTMNGSVVTIAADSLTIKNLTGSGTIKLGDNTTSSVLTIESTDNTTFAGNLTSGVLDGSKTLDLVKTGAGTLVLSGSNVLNAVTVSEGALSVEGSCSSIAVASNAKLMVSQMVKYDEATYYGIFLNTLNLATDSKLVVDLAGVQAAGETITLNIVSATAAINLGASVEGVALATADVPAIEDFVSITGNAHLSDYVKQTWTLSDNTLSLTLAIPEPSLFGLLAGLGALTLVGTRRRRSKTA